MHTLSARNAHQALPLGLDFIKHHGVENDSRNGPVLRLPRPTCIQYNSPKERVVFWPERDANPFFHLMESLWMLAGRNDLAFPQSFVSTFSNFSDDGKTLNGAYGHRWRVHFGMDQLGHIIESLKENPECRRQVLQMWDARQDLGLQSKDLPCNLMCTFQILNGKLDMCVYNRSNDLVWGALGANAVHFSVLQEYVASAIGVEVGKYYQISANMHLYLKEHGDLYTRLVEETDEAFSECPYSTAEVTPYPLMSTDVKQWQQDLLMFLDEPGTIGLRDGFFRRVATPMYLAHLAFKQNKGAERYDAPLEILQQVAAEDWKKAGIEWIQRRKEKWEAKVRKQQAEDDGVNYEQAV